MKTYQYTDESGSLLFEVCRYEPKGFAQRRPDGAGGWLYKLEGVRKVLFYLPAILASVANSETIYVVEGERDVESLVLKGLAATCNSGGSDKWLLTYTETLRGADVVIVPDRDAAGEKHLKTVGQALQGAVKRLRVLRLPSAHNGRPVKDVSDFFAAGATLEEFNQQVSAALDWQPEAAPLEIELPRNIDDVQPDPKPFALWRVSDFAKHVVDPDVDVLGKAVLRAGNLTVLIGQGGLGKSSWALALATAQITRQRSFCGLPLASGVKRWLFIGGENGIIRWKDDLFTVCSSLSTEDQSRVEDQLIVAATFADEDPNLTILESAPRLTDTITAAQADVIVLDPWSEFVEDEISSLIVRSTIHKLRHAVRSANPKCAILLLAHAKTGRESIAAAGDLFEGVNAQRGNKALTNAARSVIALFPRSPTESNELLLVCSKLNDAERFKPRAIDFNRNQFSYFVHDDFDVDGWRDDVAGKKKVKVNCTVQAVVEIVASGIGGTNGIIAKLKGTPERSVKAALAEALNLKELRRVKHGIYALPEEQTKGRTMTVEDLLGPSEPTVSHSPEAAEEVAMRKGLKREAKVQRAP